MMKSSPSPRRRSRSRVSEADPPTVSCGLFIVFEVVCFLPTILLLVWSLYYAGGLAWDGSHLQFNWHPFCMVLSMVTFLSNGIVAFRVFPFHRRARKALHALIQIMTLVSAAVGLTAVFQNHQAQSIPHLYSLHSWCGLTVACLALMQWVSGALTFILPVLSAVKRADFKPWHTRIGVLIFFAAIATCLIGINEKMTFLGNHTHGHVSAVATDDSAHEHKPPAHYSDLPNEAILCNIVGVLLLFLTAIVFFIVSQPDYTSGDKLRGFQLLASS